jgi:hypothetical protein
MSMMISGVKILDPDRIVARYFVSGACVPVTFETCVNMVIAESKGMPLPETFERLDGFDAFGYIKELNAVGPLFNYDRGL